jgi:hypothetical protein
MRRSILLFLVVVAAFILIAIILSAVFLNQTGYGPGPVVIEVTANKSVYLQGEEVNFNIYVDNPHDWSVPYPSSVSYTIEKDGPHSDCFEETIYMTYDEIPMFNPNTRTAYRELSMHWNQKLHVDGELVQAEPGKYTLTISFDGLVDYGNSGNYTFEIK